LALTARLGFKFAGGYLLGLSAARWGDRAPLLGALSLLAMAIAWAGFVTGPFYILAFGWLGAAELLEVYCRNYCLSLNQHAKGVRQLAFLNLASVLGGFAALFHGLIYQSCGFAFGLVLVAVFGLASYAGIMCLPGRLEPARFTDFGPEQASERPRSA
jgi:hypothetical protein